MKPHVKNFMDAFGIGMDDRPPCEVCSTDVVVMASVVDIHHLVYRSAGGDDNVDNLLGVCRSCHEKFHDGTFSKEDVEGWIEYAKDIEWRKNRFERLGYAQL